MSKDPLFPDCKQILTSEKLLPLAFTLVFTILAYCHCHWARDPLVLSALTYNLITKPYYTSPSNTSTSTSSPRMESYMYKSHDIT